MATTNPIDPNRCMNAVFFALVQSGVIGEHLRAFGVIGNHPAGTAEKWSLIPADMFLVMALRNFNTVFSKKYPGSHYSVFNPIANWKQVWDDCGRPGSGLTQKVRDLVAASHGTPALSPSRFVGPAIELPQTLIPEVAPLIKMPETSWVDALDVSIPMSAGQPVRLTGSAALCAMGLMVFLALRAT